VVLICAVNVRMNLVGLHPVPTWDGLCEVSTILNHRFVNLIWFEKLGVLRPIPLRNSAGSSNWAVTIAI